MNNELCSGNGSSAKNFVTLQGGITALLVLYLQHSVLLPYYLKAEWLSLFIEMLLSILFIKPDKR